VVHAFSLVPVLAVSSMPGAIFFLPERKDAKEFVELVRPSKFVTPYYG
jgi:hypothetical protein